MFCFEHNPSRDLIRSINIYIYIYYIYNIYIYIIYIIYILYIYYIYIYYIYILYIYIIYIYIYIFKRIQTYPNVLSPPTLFTRSSRLRLGKCLRAKLGTCRGQKSESKTWQEHDRNMTGTWQEHDRNMANMVTCGQSIRNVVTPHTPFAAAIL